MTVIEQPGPRQRTASAWAQVRELAALHRSISIIIGMVLIGIGLPVLASVPPLNAFQPFNAWLDGFSNAGTFVLLAVGLNIVVGLAGLLDLGYAAFFAFGAYAYAYGASPFSGNAFPFLPMLVVGAIVAATFGVLLGAPTLRMLPAFENERGAPFAVHETVALGIERSGSMGRISVAVRKILVAAIAHDRRIDATANAARETKARRRPPPMVIQGAPSEQGAKQKKRKN